MCFLTPLHRVHIRALSSQPQIEDEEEDVTEETTDSVQAPHQAPSVKVTKLPKDQTRYHLGGLLEGQGLKAKFTHIKIVPGGVLDFNHAFVVCRSSSDATEVAEFLNGRQIGRQNVAARVCGKEGMNANIYFMHMHICIVYCTVHILYNADACVHRIGTYTYRMKSKVNVIHSLMLMVFIVDLL